MLNGKSKNNTGITLVALVITIIILLILATISIQSLTNTGLLKKANEAKQKTKNAEENQSRTLNEYEDELNKYISGDIKTLVKKVADNIGSVLSTTDNTELQDAYGNKIVVPAGFKIVSDSTTNNAQTVDKGIVIEDATTEATAGSQFVWIPVGTITKEDGSTITINLDRYTFDTDGNPTAQGEKIVEIYYSETASNGNIISKDINIFKTSVAINGGYYIGRYEARTTTERTSSENPLTQITEKGTNPVYNYITQQQAASQAQNMYNNNKFTSDLINSYAWDTATLFLQNCGTNKEYSRQSSLNIGSVSQTGTTNDIQCNVYDMASNVREWSTETSNNLNNPCVSSGGLYYRSDLYTSSRVPYITSYSEVFNGFRPILYINI